MPFLESLAPASVAAPHSSYVRAALPPRFAQTDDDVAQVDTYVLPDPQTVEVAAQPKLHMPPAAVSEPEVRKPERVITTPLRVDVQSFAKPDEHAAAPIPAVATHQVARPPRTSLVNRTTLVKATAAPVDEQRAHRAIAMPQQKNAARTRRASAIVARPLSEAAAAQSAGSVQQVSSQVVNVTIDRIDVRAPDAPAKVEPKRKQQKASQSLSDYLRQGTSDRSEQR